VDLRYAFGLTAALHYFLAGCFMLLLARELGLRPAAGLVGALAFALGGFMVSWTALPTLMNTATWLPGVVWGLERAFRRREPTGPLLVAFMLAMCLLAGHLQVAVYVWLVAALHLLARAAWAAYQRRLGGTVLVIAALPIAVLLALIQLLPTLELARLSTRGTVQPTPDGFEFRRERALQPFMLQTLLLPDALGTPDDWAKSGLAYSETCGYVGRLTLLLALCGLLGLRSRQAAWFAGLAALALLGAMGTVVAKLLYFHAPGLGQAGGFGRILCVYTFAVAVVAAMGADWLTSRLAQVKSSSAAVRFAAWLPVVAAAVVCLEVGSWARSFLPLSPRERVYPPTEVTTRLAELAQEGRVLEVTRREDWTIHKLPEAVLPPNSAMAYGYDSVQGYDSLFPAVYEQFASWASPQGHAPVTNGNMVLLDDPAASGLSSAGVRWVVLPGHVLAPDGTLVERLRSGGCVLYERRAVLPRVLVGGLYGGHMTEGRLEPSGDPARVAFAADRDTVGEATVADTIYPGWRAFVDGRPAPLVLHAPMFRKVAVRPGARRVEMVYRPASFAVGAFVSLVMLGVGAGWVTCVRGRKDGRGSVEQTEA